ncbi:MAG: UPF0158 family protein [Planctomycetota bacterium]|nr:UPF0158 family protein [Planctomycetota bacterium]
MADIRIDADALFRAVTSYDYKLLAYYLDLRSGEVVSRTLTPEEVQEPPPAPRVKPLPKGGGDPNERKGEPAPFGPGPDVPKKADLFKDAPAQKQDLFGGDFWKREEKAKVNPFGEGGARRESSTKKLAALFGEKPPEAAKASGAPARKVSPDEGEAWASRLDLSQPLQRIPPADAEQHKVWLDAFARDCGDPKIRDELQAACAREQPLKAFLRVLRKYQRMEQQWDAYYRRQARHFAEAWLKAFPLSWEIVEPPRP